MLNHTITIADNLLRRVPISKPDCWKIVNGKKIPSSFAFKTKPNEDGLSVNIAALTTSEQTVAEYSNQGVAQFSASVPINAGYLGFP